MSIGGAFYAIDRYRLRALVMDPATLADLVRKPADQGGPTDSQTVEQAWDVVQALMPEAVDGEPLAGTDGLGCVYLTASHVERSAARLAHRSVPQLLRLFAEEPDRHAALYWAKAWQDDIEGLREFMEGVQRFFAAAAARRDAVVFYMA
ncbi:DUF1877 family protein [Variovorax boronicumulans]|uniref:DUF1877 family protein n=1 Tax=Variovorax boronicumulans TaxID=436515 RepID=UPI0033914E3B